MEIEGYGEIAAVPTGLFDSPAFMENYTYDGDDLGAVIHGDNTTFKVWAPTASQVVLNLFEAGDGGKAFATVDMEPGRKGRMERPGPLRPRHLLHLHRHHRPGRPGGRGPLRPGRGRQRRPGHGHRPAATDPEGFRDSGLRFRPASYGDAVIWEVHVRDFSNRIADSRWPGKYLAFTETGLTNAAGEPVGVDYLKELGVTHVHLQPVYDYATVDESSDEPSSTGATIPRTTTPPRAATPPTPTTARCGSTSSSRWCRPCTKTAWAW